MEEMEAKNSAAEERIGLLSVMPPGSVLEHASNPLETRSYVCCLFLDSIVENPTTSTCDFKFG